MTTNDERLGPYELIDELGRGGMAVVYRARDVARGREVALKVIHDERADDAHFRRRLLREARAAGAIEHPGVCEIYDVAEDRGRIYVAMELLRGETLRESLEAGPLDPAHALDLAIALADVVAAAHAGGVIHRDIKPDNIMLTDGGLKLLDFGIARHAERHISASEAETALTREGAIVGTPGYMAPEQMLGLGVDERSDIFAMGVTLYVTLTGELPFGGQTLMEIAVNVVRDEPAPLSEHFDRSWPALEQTVADCLAKDPVERLASARELRARLEQHRQEWAQGPRPVSLPPTERAPAPRPWGAATMAVGAAGVILAMAGWAFWPKDVGSSSTPVGTAVATSRLDAEPSAVAITDLPLPQSNEKARVAYGRALAAFRDGSWGRARAELVIALEQDPNLPSAHLRLALFHGASSSGNAAAARDAYQRAAAMRDGLPPRDRELLLALEPMLARTPPSLAAASERLAELADERPQDAELSFLAAWSLLGSGNRDEALSRARRAVALDPKYADPWQLIGNALVARGDDVAAREPLERCAALSPSSADCLIDLMAINSRLGECVATLDLARQFTSRVSDQTGPRTLAWALAGAGSEPPAVIAAISRADERDDDPLRIALYRIRVAVWSGRLRDALSASEEALVLAETNEDLAAYARPALLRAQLLEELDGPSAAAQAAKAFLDRAAALVDAPLAKPAQDPTMEMWRIRADAGEVDDRELAAAQGAWLERWRERSGDATSVWLSGVLRPVRAAAEAKDALAKRPRSISWHQAFRDPDTMAVLGRAELLAGDVDLATTTLRRAASDCRILESPISVTRASSLLGRALEAKGDRAGACEAYERVVARWATSPESRTRREALARREALCSR